MKNERKQAKSYTCALQKAIYRDNPGQFKRAPDQTVQLISLKDYSLSIHPRWALQQGMKENGSHVEDVRQYLSSDFMQPENSLPAREQIGYSY